MASHSECPVDRLRKQPSLISHGATLGIGGFTDPGCPHAVPRALAQRARVSRESSREAGEMAPRPKGKLHRGPGRCRGQVRARQRRADDLGCRGGTRGGDHRGAHDPRRTVGETPRYIHDTAGRPSLLIPEQVAGEPALGPHLRHDRGPPAGAPDLPGNLQHRLDRRATRLQDTRAGPCRTASTRGQSRVAFNPVSHKPRAVHGRHHLGMPGRLHRNQQLFRYWQDPYSRRKTIPA
jgi:hypothetical protein